MIPEQALLMAAEHLAVLPIGPGTKFPPFERWPEQACDDPEVFEEWWGSHPEWGVGWKMGLQPDGRFLFAIDVDVDKGGREAFRRLMLEFGLRAEFEATVRARTGGGGFHFVFELPGDAPLVPSNRSKLRAGIDVRSEGGQIVVAPSLHPVSGLRYAWEPGKAPWQIAPLVASVALCAMLVALLAPASPVRPVPEVVNGWHPSMGEPSPADWVRAHLDWWSYLVKHGWDHLGGEAWRRPGKTDRGSSAQLHGDGQGPLNVFTTELPPSLERLGRPDASGQCLSFTLFDFIAGYEFGGDRSACASWVRSQMVRGGAQRAAGHAPMTDPTSGDEVSQVANLSAAFWSSRPALAHILTAAQAGMCSPDALLVYALARTATFVHPCFKLPGTEQGLIGKLQTLDFLGCVVAETSGGKTMAAGVGEMLIPAPDPPADGTDPAIDFEQKVGTGEGIAEFFLVPGTRIDPETGKEVQTGRKVIGKQALFMSVDEGTGFTRAANRPGTTIVAALASAWSGESLGALNAAAETRRLVQGGRVRVCCVINMQDSNGHLLYAPELESVGFTGRLLFASAHNPDAPDVEPSWPGPLDWPVHLVRNGKGSNQFFTYDPTIVTEIKTTRRGILRAEVRIQRRQSQYLLLRCKVAALLAVWEGRFHVTIDDWTLATTIIDASVRTLDHLDHVHQTDQEVTAVTAAVKRRVVDEQATTIHLKQLSIGWQTKVMDRLRKGPLPWKGLKDIVASGHRSDLKRVVEQMAGDGVIVLNGTNYEITR